MKCIRWESEGALLAVAIDLANSQRAKEYFITIGLRSKIDVELEVNLESARSFSIRDG